MEYYKMHIDPTMCGHFAYFKLETNGICNNKFSVKGERKTKEDTKNAAL